MLKYKNTIEKTINISFYIYKLKQFLVFYKYEKFIFYINLISLKVFLLLFKNWLLLK